MRLGALGAIGALRALGAGALGAGAPGVPGAPGAGAPGAAPGVDALGMPFVCRMNAVTAWYASGVSFWPVGGMVAVM